MTKNIVGIIPARGGSKGIPRKNLYNLNGKPLVAYTIEAALASKYINKVIVSTEDTEIADVCREYGAEIIERPMELAQDETKTAPVLKQVVDELKKEGYIPDIIVTLQPTSPLRGEDVIDEVIEKLFNSECDSAFAGNLVFKNQPRWEKDESGKLKALYDYHLRPRRQDVTEFVYEENGAVYAIKADVFDKRPDMLGDCVDVVVMEEEESAELDTYLDLLVIEELLKAKNKD